MMYFIGLIYVRPVEPELYVVGNRERMKELAQLAKSHNLRVSYKRLSRTREGVAVRGVLMIVQDHGVVSPDARACQSMLRDWAEYYLENELEFEDAPDGAPGWEE